MLLGDLQRAAGDHLRVVFVGTARNLARDDVGGPLPDGLIGRDAEDALHLPVDHQVTAVAVAQMGRNRCEFHEGLEPCLARLQGLLGTPAFG